MASLLKLLSDDDREAINHMIRRDAHTDLEIGKDIQKRLPANHSNKRESEKTEKALESMIQRYRKSREYEAWLKRWENQDVELKRQIALQKQRFELLSNLVKDPDSNGMETLSKSLQARLLTLAAESSDEELVEGASKNGWIKSVIKVIQDQAKLEDNAKADKLKEEIDKLSNGGEKSIDPKKLVERVDDVMGLRKKA